MFRVVFQLLGLALVVTLLILLTTFQIYVENELLKFSSTSNNTGMVSEDENFCNVLNGKKTILELYLGLRTCN